MRHKNGRRDPIDLDPSEKKPFLALCGRPLKGQQRRKSGGRLVSFADETAASKDDLDVSGMSR